MVHRLVVVGLPLLVVACTSSSSGGGPGGGNPLAPDFDSGAGDSAAPAVDGTAPVDAGGDRSVGEASTTDSGPEDAGVDAPSDSGPVVTVTVSNDVGREPGVTVLFESAGGAPLGAATTDSNGTVSSPLGANSQVTVVLGPPGSPGALITIQGVEPGDALTVIDTVNVAFPVTSSSANVTIESVADGGLPTQVDYSSKAGACFTGSGSLPETLKVGGFPCEVNGTFPLLVTALDHNGGELGYVYRKGNALSAGGSAIALTTPWSSPGVVQTLSSTNVPSTSQEVWFTFSEVAGGVETAAVSYYGTTTGDAGTLGGSLPFPTHPGFAEGIQAESVTRRYESALGVATYTSIATRAAAPDASADMLFDMSQVLPAITASSVDSSDAGTPSAPVFTWSSSASLAATDGLVLVAQGNLATEAGSTSVPWTIVAPPSSVSVTPPVLPTSLGAWTVQSSTTLLVIAADATFISGYAQFRSVAGALPTSPSLVQDVPGQVTAPLPADGTMRMTAVGSGN